MTTGSKLAVVGALVTVVLLPPLAKPAQACVQPFVGDICTFAFDFCPAGFLNANGQLVSISQYATLFKLIGTTFGGDGQSTFAVPDLQGSAALGTGAGGPLPETLLGQAGGSTNTVSVRSPGRATIPAQQLPSLSLTSCIAYDGTYPSPP